MDLFAVKRNPRIGAAARDRPHFRQSRSGREWRGAKPEAFLFIPGFFVPLAVVLHALAIRAISSQLSTTISKAVLIGSSAKPVAPSVKCSRARGRFDTENFNRFSKRKGAHHGFRYRDIHISARCAKLGCRMRRRTSLSNDLLPLRA
jgi:hypothetical protein